MRVPYEWLKAFVACDLPPEKLGDRLTMGGIEVESIEGRGNDAILTLGITPNRGDCLSIIGVSREVAALLKKPLRIPRPKKIFGKALMKGEIALQLTKPKRAVRYTARFIKGVQIGPSPRWLSDRLQACGLRSVNNVVDAANYVMLERGQPLHVFDLAKLAHQKLIIDTAKEGERFQTLDGIDRRLSREDLLIRDGAGPVALAGIMGGSNAEVSPSTTDLLLESACFEPIGIRRTAKRLGLMTESSRRFERGVDPHGVLEALHRLTELIIESAGGRASEDYADLSPVSIRPLKIALDAREIHRILGYAIPMRGAVSHLTSLGCVVQKKSKSALFVSVPTFRPDLSRPIDLIEEIGRLQGYEGIPERIPARRTAELVRPEHGAATMPITRALLSAGFSEACLMALADERKERLFSSPDDDVIALANPLSSEMSVMRRTLLTGLLDAYRVNRHRQRVDIRFFALQRVFKGTPLLHREPQMVAGVMAGARYRDAWEGGALKVDFYDVKGIVEQIFDAVGMLPRVLFEASSLSFLHPRLASSLTVDGKQIGFCGALHQSIAHEWDLKEEVHLFEINIDELLLHSRPKRVRFEELQRYPFVERDISLLIDAAVPAGSIIKTIHEVGGEFVTRVNVFDCYSGKGIPAEKKSMAFSIRFSSPIRTLTDEEVVAASQRIIDALSKRFNALLRT